MVLKTEIDSVLKVYKDLTYNSLKNEINGELKLVSGDAYNIRIDLSPYPDFFPSVFEIDERIPKKADRHIYTDSGACCFTTSAKSQILLKTNITSLKLFLDEIVIKYFENNSYYEINGQYCSEEYAHGSNGIVESYKDILQIQNIDIIGYLIVERLNNIILPESTSCFCNSTIPLKECNSGRHLSNYQKFLLINKQTLENDLEHFRKVIKRKK